MSKGTAARVVALSALVFTGSLWAHHSASMFDMGRPIWVKGTVVRYEAMNPHAFFALEARGDDGAVSRWTVEGPSLARLARMGVEPETLRVGDVIEVCGFPPKEQSVGLYEGRSGPWSAPVMHGHLLVMPNGRMQLWGSYGKLVNCVRRSDPVARWVDFLSADPGGRQTWCMSRRMAGSATLPPQELLDEIGAALADPCD
jgi:hypothetical protein